MKLSILLLSTFLLSGCATLPTVSSLTPEQITELSSHTVDEFTKVSKTKGPEIALGGFFGLDRYWLQFTYSNKVKSNGTYNIIVKTLRSTREGWAFWEQAYDIKGNPLYTQSLRRDVLDGGMTQELVSILLTRDYIERIAAGAEAMKFRLDGKNARYPFEINPNEAKGFLVAVDKY